MMIRPAVPVREPVRPRGSSAGRRSPAWPPRVQMTAEAMPASSAGHTSASPNHSPSARSISSTPSPTRLTAAACCRSRGRAGGSSSSPGSSETTRPIPYSRMPAPPASASTTKKIRSSTGSTPVRAPSPPATPRRTRSRRERRKRVRDTAGVDGAAGDMDACLGTTKVDECHGPTRPAGSRPVAARPHPGVPQGGLGVAPHGRGVSDGGPCGADGATTAGATPRPRANRPPSSGGCHVHPLHPPPTGPSHRRPRDRRRGQRAGRPVRSRSRPGPHRLRGPRLRRRGRGHHLRRPVAADARGRRRRRPRRHDRRPRSGLLDRHRAVRAGRTDPGRHGRRSVLRVADRAHRRRHRAVALRRRPLAGHDPAGRCHARWSRGPGAHLDPAAPALRRGPSCAAPRHRRPVGSVGPDRSGRPGRARGPRLDPAAGHVSGSAPCSAG